MEQVEIGIIGGSGFYRMKNVKNSRTFPQDTPFGRPSDELMVGELNGRTVAFLSRHGRGHRLNPSEVNYRANLFAMKMLGVEKLISVTAVGSLKEELQPMHLVIPDQYFDNTFKREKTFFEEGIVAHVSMAEPTCLHLSKKAAAAAREIGIPLHLGGVYFNMEGPQFSSKAESNFYRNQGFSIIGMTQAVEAKLARELEMCFLPLAFVTDYDCWHEEEGPVNVEMVIEYLNKNVENAVRLIESLTRSVERERTHCDCADSLKNALITSPGLYPQKTLKKLEPIIKKYLKKRG
jgi:5'-methylthioadenosine phosphorylase